jgi:hypothetical protein
MHCPFTVALWRISQSRTATGQSGAGGCHSILPSGRRLFSHALALPPSSRGEPDAGGFEDGADGGIV